MNLDRRGVILGILGAYAVFFTVLFLSAMPTLFVGLKPRNDPLAYHPTVLDHVPHQGRLHPITHFVLGIAERRWVRHALSAIVSLAVFVVTASQKGRSIADLFCLGVIGLSVLFAALNLWVLFSMFVF